MKALVEGARDVKKLSKSLAADAQQKIEKALGQKLDRGDLSPKLYTVSTGRETLTACVTTVTAPKGPLRLAVVVGKDPRSLHSIQHVGLLSHKEDKAIADDLFLAQFLERTATANAYNPPATLDEAAKKDDPEVKRLLEFLQLMNRNHELYYGLVNDKIPKKNPEAAADAKALSALLEEARSKGGQFSGILKPDELKLFDRQAREGQEAAKRGETALAKKDASGKPAPDFVAAQGAYDELGCAKCHGSFRKAFQERRQALQIGNGYFKVGHDVVAAKKGAEAASQAVATGVKKALLILDCVLQ